MSKENLKMEKIKRYVTAMCIVLVSLFSYAWIVQTRFFSIEEIKVLGRFIDQLAYLVWMISIGGVSLVLIYKGKINEVIYLLVTSCIFYESCKVLNTLCK